MFTRAISRLKELIDALRNPFDFADTDVPDSSPDFMDPDDFGAPDTQPTSPGALDSDRGRL